MSCHQLSHEDYEALEKFTKFFLAKSAQCIVQSRLGEKKSSKSKSICSGNEWFHLSIKDIPEVTVNAKQCLIDTEHLPINSPHHSFCVEISLRTIDSEIIPLETWCISFDDSFCDPTQRVRYSIYNRMSIVLRSLVTCTRATPAYQLSRKQSADKYIICYKIISGEPIVSHLGEDYSKKTIGHILTPIGQFVLNVAYRTRITIASNSVEHSSNDIHLNSTSVEMRDDHFSSEKYFQRDFDGQMCSIDSATALKSSPIDMNKRRHTSSDSISSSHETPEKIYYSKLRQAFGTPSIVPHISQMNSLTNDHEQQHSKSSSLINNDFDNENAPDDFILVEVKPFFGRSDSTDDLALFIRSCQQPPILDAFIIEPSLTETINQLSDELRIFESKVEEFDELVTHLDAQKMI